MDSEFGLGLEARGKSGEGLDEPAAEHAVAGEHVLNAITENEAHHAGQHQVAEAVAVAVGRLDVGDPHAVDHVELVVDQEADHLGRGAGLIGIVAIGKDVEVGLHVGEHAPHHMALALLRFGAHDGAGRARRRHGPIGRVVVVDVDRRPRQRGPEVGDHLGDRDFLVIAGEQDGDGQVHSMGLRPPIGHPAAARASSTPPLSSIDRLDKGSPPPRRSQTMNARARPIDLRAAFCHATDCLKASLA